MTNQEIRNITSESLRDWFKKEKWVRISSSGNIAGPCGTSKNKKNPDRCLPRAKAQSLTKAQRAATARKKKKAGAKGKTVVKNTKAATVKKENQDRSFTKDDMKDYIYETIGGYLERYLGYNPGPSDHPIYKMNNEQFAAWMAQKFIGGIDELLHETDATIEMIRETVEEVYEDYKKVAMGVGHDPDMHFEPEEEAIGRDALEMVLQTLNKMATPTKLETANPQDGKAAPFGSGYKPTKKMKEEKEISKKQVVKLRDMIKSLRKSSKGHAGQADYLANLIKQEGFFANLKKQNRINKIKKDITKAAGMPTPQAIYHSAAKFYQKFKEEGDELGMQVAKKDLDLFKNKIEKQYQINTNEAGPIGFGAGYGRSKTISKGREARPDLAKARKDAKVAPKKYTMVKGVPHKYDADGKLVPLKKMSEKMELDVPSPMTKDALLKLMKGADDALVQLYDGTEYLVYSPYSDNDDNASMWGDDSVIGLNRDGDEREFKYDDIVGVNVYNNETKGAPSGHYFTKSGNLVKGTLTKDKRERGARLSDPKDKQRSKIPPVTQYNEEVLNTILEKCWKGYEKKGMKTMFGKRVPNCVKKEDIRNLVVGIIHEMRVDEKKKKKKKKDDRCTRRAKREYDTWPSAYASGAVVRCRRGEIWTD